MSDHGRPMTAEEVATWRLYRALDDNDPAEAEDAVRQGANPDAAFADESALHIAVDREYVSLVETLLGHGADPSPKSWPFEGTPLHGAAWRGNVPIARMLIAAGAAINQATRAGGTPLHTAMERSDLRMILVLLAHGAEPTLRNRSGETILHFVGNTDLYTYRYVLSLSTDLETRDAFGATPLTYAAAHGRGDIIRALIDAGANRDHTDQDGYTPAAFALREGQPEAAALLGGYHARPSLDKEEADELHDTLGAAALELLEPRLLAFLEDRDGALTPDAAADVARASELLERVVALNPSNWSAFWYAGIAYKMVGELERGYQCLRTAYALQDGLADIGREFAEICSETARHREAVRTAVEVVDLDPDNAGLVATLGLVLLRAGSLESASAMVERALKLDPKDPITLRLEQALETSRGL